MKLQFKKLLVIVPLIVQAQTIPKDDKEAQVSSSSSNLSFMSTSNWWPFDRGDSSSSSHLSLVSTLTSILADVAKIITLQNIQIMESKTAIEEEPTETKQPIEVVEKRDLVDDLLVKVFTALKDSGLVTSIVKMSLTDDEVRPAITEITIDLIEADVIPYEEVFVALKDSGLAVDVIRNILLDPETREGAVLLIREMVPELMKPTPVTSLNSIESIHAISYNNTSQY
ncbi:hypothetical protein CAAN1_12S04698 [[Candida] anglica]|uniref:Uncharacterized protein n=1 Tax=[Candida] anglica TaxID=148631 RepID=A0ABP0E8N2_9ASCO